MPSSHASSASDLGERSALLGEKQLDHPDLESGTFSHIRVVNESCCERVIAHASHCFDYEEKPKQRKVPVKIEPKVFFANERTFLVCVSFSCSSQELPLRRVLTRPYLTL